MIAQLASLSSKAAPSPFHRFLKVLDERGQLLRLYTQNIDNLEEKAGLSYGVPSWPTTSKGTQTPALDLPDATLSPSPSRLAPRCIPLHGTLKQLVCQRCAHAIPLENELETLAGGHSVACPQCTSNGSMRRMEGKRDRGVGRMRPSVVLYGEDHLAGEGVGEWYVYICHTNPKWLQLSQLC
jgi:NAD-dependent SIR2 family protein deacetylase